MKKMLSILLVVLLALGLVGCSSQKDKTVDITIPAEFFEMSNEEFDYQLTEEDKENGFTAITKNEDGSATYTIAKSKYDVFIAEYKEETKKALDSLSTDGNFTSVKSVTYNDNFSEITITVDKDAFEGSFDSIAIMSCGLTSWFYQLFDVDSTGQCVVQVKDAATGEIFQTETYPQ